MGYRGKTATGSSTTPFRRGKLWCFGGSAPTTRCSCKAGGAGTAGAAKRAWYTFRVRRAWSRSLAAWPLLAASLAAACSQPPLQLNTIQLGRGLNPDKTVNGFTTRFKPDDTIYAAVLTSNAGSGTVKARWLFGDRVVSEPEKQVSYKGPASTEFHLQNTSGGFPPGDYSVELFLDGKSVGSRPFRVETSDGKTEYTFPNTTPKH